MTVRILVVGHGLIGAQRARAIVERGHLAGASLAGTVDPLPRRPGLPASVPHHASLDAVDRGAFDAAVIALPHHLAKDAALRLLGMGVPVLVEKPLGLRLADAEAVAGAAARVPLPSFVGYNYRFLPAMVEVRARLARGFFGRLRCIDMVLGHGGNPRSTEGWKLRPEYAGSGALIDPGVHLVDLLLGLEPRLELRHASATRGFWPTGIQEEVVLVGAHDGVLATMRASLVRWINTMRIEVVGDDGYALLEGRGTTYGSQTLRLGKRWGWDDGSRRSQRETEETFDYGLDNRSLDDEMEAVARIWAGGAKGATAPASMAEALRVAALCDAAERMIAAPG